MSDRKFRLGFIVNAYAGLGGEVGLKGSDGDDIVAEALKRNAPLRAPARAQRTLEKLTSVQDQFELFCFPQTLGEQVALAAGLTPIVVGQPKPDAQRTTAADTEVAAQQLAAMGMDLILFAGGDGTARNICNVMPPSQPVLGIPAGVKIHSGVYAITPESAAEVVLGLIRGDLTDIRSQEVRDIDEARLRQGEVNARYYGELTVPEEGRFMQQVKQGGLEVEALVLQDIADYLIEEIQNDTLYIVAPGTTTQALMEQMGLPNTLLGFDLMVNQQVIAQDVSAQQIRDALAKYSSAKVIVTPIGGQGHVIGRGNHQLAADILQTVGRDNLMVIATKTKLKNLLGRPLLIDSNNPELDQAWAGYIAVITGYRDQVLYPLQ